MPKKKTAVPFIDRNDNKYSAELSVHRNKFMNAGDDLKRLECAPGDTELMEKCRTYLQEIELIGDPLVRGKLLNLYDRFFSERFDARRFGEEIGRLLENKQCLSNEDRMSLADKLAQLAEDMRI